jgi:iron complex outermembrane receptor protein
MKRSSNLYPPFSLVVLFSWATFCAQGQDLEVGALKAMSMDELLDIQVTSVSKRNENISETASAIQVITNEDIFHSGATSLPEVLRLASNLQVAQVNSSQWAVSARGFNNVLANKLLVLIDGRVVYTPMYGGVFWDVQNLLLEDIDRIEVISGPGGTLWGANAVNGVINVITKSSKETRGLYGEAALGTELRSTVGVRYGGTISDKLFYRVYGTAFKRGNTIFQDSVDARDDWQTAHGGIRLDWVASENSDVALISNIYEARPDPDGGAPVIASGGNALIRWNYNRSGRSSLQVQAFYDRTWRDFRNGFAEELGTYDFDAQHRYSLAKVHQVVYGFGLRLMHHNVKNLELFAFNPAKKTLYLYNVFLQDEIRLAKEKLRLTLGLKVEYATYTDFQYLPNARLAWTATRNQTVWGAVSRAVRNPARIDREFNLDLAPGIRFIEGSDFKSEKVTAYELGWKSQAPGKLTIGVAAFYNVYDDIRSVEPGPPPFGIPVTFGNGVEGNTRGAEISFAHQLGGKWKLRGGYTFLKKDLRLKEKSKDMNEASAESNDPNHQILIQSIAQVHTNLSIGAVARYVDQLRSPSVPSYVGLDIQFSFKLHENIQFNLTGQNLLQKYHTEFVPSSPEPKDIERSIYGKILCRI